MGKVRRKHNWKGRQQSDSQQPSEKEKTDVVVELQGRNTNCESKNCLNDLALFYIVVIWLWFLTFSGLFVDGGRLKGVDESNALVLPSSKAKNKIASVKPVSSKKPLTKKQRKELQKVLERKEKKAQVGLGSSFKPVFFNKIFQSFCHLNSFVSAQTNWCNHSYICGATGQIPD